MLVCQRRMRRQPMIDTVLEGAELGIQTAKPSIIFSNAGALVEEGLPIVTRPAGSVIAQQGENLCLVPGYGLEDNQREERKLPPGEDVHLRLGRLPLLLWQF
jgi:hypothetical protein